jgi:hypothetical protein
MSGSQSWSVRIVPAAGGAAAFQPWGVSAKPGDPVKAQVGDVVTWGNATSEPHQPWPTERNTPNGPPAGSNPPGSPLFFSEEIAPNSSSTPQYQIPDELPATTPSGQPTPLTAGSVIYYCCLKHPTERGQIVIF